MRSNILSKRTFASCVWYSDRAYYGLCVLIKDIGRRLPLQLQCSYQGQQGDVRQSVRGNYKTRFWGGQNLTAVEGNASVYQVNPIYTMYIYICSLYLVFVYPIQLMYQYIFVHATCITLVQRCIISCCYYWYHQEYPFGWEVHNMPLLLLILLRVPFSVQRCVTCRRY